MADMSLMTSQTHSMQGLPAPKISSMQVNQSIYISISINWVQSVTARKMSS